MNNFLKPLILVVDDNPSNLAMIGKLLSYNGYKVDLSGSGEDALKSIKNKKPDLVVLDLVMPGMDGLEVCKKLKNDSETHHIPILFCSGSTERKDIKNCFDAGGADYTIKPIESILLLSRIETHLELNRLRRQHQQDKKND
ncbi:MAG: response regulator [Proteobacteria bacterium]|nr:response regulator [Pseudomonadota bacterium]MBU1583262.1 response regulator [Pseudomonadota bacterium]MBU2454929.1 response regulator [Pseudomonadota bacterium]MBU2628257.1 response regulator [Pseudomonadota bacterium]